MLGAIIGDLAGSLYEYEQMKRVQPILIENLIDEKSFISDDTILTIAILNAVLTDKDYEKNLKEFGLKYEKMLPNVKPYFKTVFSPNFVKWLHGNYKGTSGGNGAMMRVSPIGFLFDNMEDVEKNALLATIPSHNSKEAITSAQTIAKIIFLARHGATKEEIIKRLNLNIKKPKIEKFNYLCSDTIDVCLYSFFTANNFEESIKLVLSFGGDTDTNACIVGSMSEAIFGIDKNLEKQALTHIPEEFKNILKVGYERIQNNSHLKNKINLD